MFIFKCQNGRTAINIESIFQYIYNMKFSGEKSVHNNNNMTIFVILI